MKILLALLSLAATVIPWLIKRSDETVQQKKEKRQEIKDAIFSGDVSRINATIQRLRK